MSRSIVITERANAMCKGHLLKHVWKGDRQEDLCFALWRRSTGLNRRTAIVHEVILPRPNERNLHGNASFEPGYLARAIRLARERRSGLVFMHSHPKDGWQGLSKADTRAERDIIAFPAGATKYPLVGMTTGSDGYWSGRFWEPSSDGMKLQPCESVRELDSKSYKLYFDDSIVKPNPRREKLRRTFDAWGTQAQNDISRLKVGIVGLGSVGGIVAEAMARIGVSDITLIDPDSVEEHNLDRLLYATHRDIGQRKVDLARNAIKRNATAKAVNVNALPLPIQDTTAYRSALDCDILFSCVDRPVARDTLNFIANSHLIPVIDGGVAVQTDRRSDSLFSAHWRAHIVTPYHQCMRCNGQYNSSLVVAELDGSLDDPTYIASVESDGPAGNQNVFPFALGVAGLEVNLMLRYLLAKEWWPSAHQQEFQFLTGKTQLSYERCYNPCAFIPRRALGDASKPAYLSSTSYVGTRSRVGSLIVAIRERLFPKA